MVEAEQMVETEGPQLPPEAEKFLRQEYQKYVDKVVTYHIQNLKQLVLQQASGEQGPEQEDNDILNQKQFKQNHKCL